MTPADYTVEIRSTLDGSMQRAMFVPRPPGAGPVPLLVALHQWSHGYDVPGWEVYEQVTRERGWVVIHPDFRGENVRPQACASELAVRDVLDAVAYACERARIDRRRIYLTGVSGGGFMSMVMAHRAPRLWAAVSAWAGISDLAAWHEHCRRVGRKYASHLEAVCGGPPGDPAADAQYRARSPIHHLAWARGLPFDICTGIHDGHTGSVPVSHTLRAFNVLAVANGCPQAVVSDADIQHMVQHRSVPPALAFNGEQEPRRNRVLFRRQAGPARVTIFEGGHEIDEPTAVAWLSGFQRSEEPSLNPDRVA
jgi:poly(3-hydroxybutyrate) depolymerase